MALLCACENGTELLLNTPNRKELLKDGPPQNTKCNVLGRGSYGTVFKGIFSGKQVAVKLVKNVREACVQSMKNESHVLGWKHPNIVGVFKIESTLNFGIVIMERFVGRTLEQIIEQVQLPLKHRLLISLDILSALTFCHKRQLLHMDVKPQNVLVALSNEMTPMAGRSYVCKLCDFGSSLTFQEQKETPTARTNRNAQGTIRYMSPEALSGESVTTAADIYSLGISMWQMQQRRIPYHWIECNEIVAYQVVKNNLRPDRKSPCPCTSNLSQLGRGCDCRHQAENAELSPASLQQVKEILRKHNTEVNAEDSCYLSSASNRAVNSPAKRKPFQELNSNTQRNAGNVVRNLQFDGRKPVRDSKAKAKELSVEDSQLCALFECGESIQMCTAAEAAYASNCRDCWLQDFNGRPDDEDLRERLKQQLKTFLFV